MKTFRQSVFETNSSSTHSIAILPNSAKIPEKGSVLNITLTMDKDGDFINDSSFKIMSLYSMDSESTISFLNELEISVFINLDNLYKFNKYVYYSYRSLPELPIENLDLFTSYIWGSSYEAINDNNHTASIDKFHNDYEKEGYITAIEHY